MERATVSCKPSLVMVRERELSTGGTILGKGLCSKGSVNGMEVLAVLGTQAVYGVVVHRVSHLPVSYNSMRRNRSL